MGFTAHQRNIGCFALSGYKRIKCTEVKGCYSLANMHVMIKFSYL